MEIMESINEMNNAAVAENDMNGLGPELANESGYENQNEGEDLVENEEDDDWSRFYGDADHAEMEEQSTTSSHVETNDAEVTEPPQKQHVSEMMEVILNDRLGKKIRVKCNTDDTVGDLKKLVAVQIGTRPEKIRLQRAYNVLKNHISLADYEIKDGMGLELYYD